MKFNLLYIDPPWSYRDTLGANRGLNHGGASFHYPTMDREGLLALPVQQLAADDSWLFLWATWPNIDVALEVMKQWGFTYKSCAFLWVKTYSGEVATNDNTAMGLGSYTRANTEPVLFGVRGRLHRVGKNVRQVVVGPRTRHSAKPPIVRERIVQLGGDLPRVELFARGDLPGGWYGWGNEFSGGAGVPVNPEEWGTGGSESDQRMEQAAGKDSGEASVKVAGPRYVPPPKVALRPRDSITKALASVSIGAEGLGGGDSTPRSVSP